MEEFTLFANPWWVNLFFFVPFIFYYFCKKNLDLPKKLLLITGIFGISFGFVETSVVVYLRNAIGISSSSITYFDMTENLLHIEIFREMATIVMLASVAFLSARKWPERWAIFFWIFAIWDIFYYAYLRITIGWPSSFLAPDILFLIPVPWTSQVWFPILISIIFLLLVILRRKNAQF